MASQTALRAENLRLLHSFCCEESVSGTPRGLVPTKKLRQENAKPIFKQKTRPLPKSAKTLKFSPEGFPPGGSPPWRLSSRKEFLQGGNPPWRKSSLADFFDFHHQHVFVAISQEKRLVISCQKHF